MPDSWKVLHRTLPAQVRENWMEIEDKVIALLGLHPIPREQRSDVQYSGLMTTVYELMSASLLLMPDDKFEDTFGITARRKR